MVIKGNEKVRDGPLDLKRRRMEKEMRETGAMTTKKRDSMGKFLLMRSMRKGMMERQSRSWEG